MRTAEILAGRDAAASGTATSGKPGGDFPSAPVGERGHVL